MIPLDWSTLSSVGVRSVESENDGLKALPMTTSRGAAAPHTLPAASGRERHVRDSPVVLVGQEGVFVALEWPCVVAKALNLLLMSCWRDIISISILFFYIQHFQHFNIYQSQSQTAPALRSSCTMAVYPCLMANVSAVTPSISWLTSILGSSRSSSTVSVRP